MNKLNLIFTQKAYDDLNSISDFIAKDNVIASKEVIGTLLGTCSMLARFPDLGIRRPDFSHKEIKFYITKKHYIIAYKIIKNDIYIVRVLSSYQDICALF